MIKNVLATIALGLMFQSLMAGETKPMGMTPPASLDGMESPRAFYYQLPKSTSEERMAEYEKFIDTDPDFVMGNKYLYDQEFRLTEKDIYDPEFPAAPKNVSMPNYPSALDSFYKSVRKVENPIAAYEGHMIIKTYLGYKFKNAKKYDKLFVDVLYKYRTCEGMLEKGRNYMYGKNEKRDLYRAVDIFTEAEKLCKDNGFYGISIYSKKSAAKIKLRIMKDNKKKGQ